MGNVGALPQVWETHIVAQALLVISDFHHALFPHSGRMVKIPRQGTEFPRAFRLLRKVLRIRSIAKTPAVQSNTAGAVFGKITFPLYRRNTH